MKVNTIYNQDCIAGMATLKAKSVNLIITDPPFAIKFKAKKANYNRKKKNVLDGYVEISEEEYPQFTKDWIRQAERVLRDDGQMYVFSGDQGLRHILNNLANYGFEFRHLVWNFPFGTYAKNNYIMAHYSLIFAWKKKHKPRLHRSSRFNTTKEQYHDMQSVWKIKREYWTGRKKTATKLPSEIIEKILNYSSKKNDLVMDPFIGSGQVAAIAKKMKRRYIGFEKSPKYYQFATNHLASV